MNSNLLEYLKKYIWFFIIGGILSLPFNWFFKLDMDKFFEINATIGYLQIGIKIIIAILLYFDFSKENLSNKYKYFAVFSSLFYGLFGVVIFSLLFLEKNLNNKRNVA
ncbi:hypothetical protein [Faecalibacter rhinopitheci]|uniref:Uncharacterized protein n=1 Tax=Faecalibacter rhinopitheci TaxID=2779678 RepID=A0A8J7FT65_9FLAO|nr:hypothetical protein [Faecalibacter rhinopitheci]MBF0598455.1 hypothetical protein [Faecalibacter rhinopitheci]